MLIIKNTRFIVKYFISKQNVKNPNNTAANIYNFPNIKELVSY